MKKSNILIFLGGFIILTVFLCMNSDNKIYEKQVKFQSVNELLQQLETYPISAINEKGHYVETNQFKECLSKRKRISYSYINYTNLEIKKIIELTDTEKKEQISIYNQRNDQFMKKNKISKIEPISLIIKGKYEHNSDGEQEKVNLILIDEGEGYVIDSIDYSNYEDKVG